MAIQAGLARFSGTGALRADAQAFRLIASNLNTGSPQTAGELLAGNVAPDLPIPAGISQPSSAGNGVAVRASDRAGGQQTGQAGQDFFLVEGLLAVVLGDKVQAHGQQKHGSDRTMIEGLDWFKINGI